MTSAGYVDISIPQALFELVPPVLTNGGFPVRTPQLSKNLATLCQKHPGLADDLGLGKNMDVIHGTFPGSSPENSHPDPIFTITESSVDRRFGILSRLAGIKVTPHLLRHSTCYSMRKGGADFMDRKMQLRHNCTESTIAYERAEPQALIELAKEREWR
jgi:integrase